MTHPPPTTIASQKLGAGGPFISIFCYLSSAPVYGVHNSNLDMITALMQQRLAGGAGAMALS